MKIISINSEVQTYFILLCFALLCFIDIDLVSGYSRLLLFKHILFFPVVFVDVTLSKLISIILIATFAHFVSKCHILTVLALL